MDSKYLSVDLGQGLSVHCIKNARVRHEYKVLGN